MATQIRMPVTALLGSSMFFSGITYAATLPYSSLVGIDTLGMSPASFAGVMAFGGMFGTIVSLLLGYLSDKIRDRRILVLIATAAGVAANGLIYLWPSIEAFSIAMALLVPIAGAAFSQSFAYIRVFYAKTDPKRADFMVTALRTVFTAAWVIIPPVAGWIAAEFSIFDVYLVAALSYAVTGLTMPRS